MVQQKDDSPIELVRLNARHPYALRIGTGVGSEIFLAMQQGEGNTFQRLVAVKKVATLFDGSGQNELIREIRAAAGLSHPNIVRVYGAEKSGARLLVSMEYVYGHRLSTLMTAMRERKLALPMPILLRMIGQACEALHHAHHAKGLDQNPLNLVHRDVSPETIMLDVHGYLRIVDFGLAKLAGGEDTTIPGRVKGRFLYMPIEQMRGDVLDSRSDTFSLGMTFYELATLEKPRLARNIKAAYDEALEPHQVTPISKIRGCSTDVDALFYKATASDPKDRFQSAREFSKALEQLAKQVGGLATAAATEAWLEENFSDLRKRREGFERAFAESVERLNESKTSVPLPTEALEEKPRTDGVGGGESATRVLMVGILALLVAMVTFTVHYLNRERDALRFTEGFQIENDANEASVFVLSMPERATLYVDDEVVGKISRLGITLQLEPGLKHRLRLELSGYETYEVTVDGQAGVADQVIAQMVPLSVRPSKKRKTKVEVFKAIKPQSPVQELPRESGEIQPAPDVPEVLGVEKEIENFKVTPPNPESGLHTLEWRMGKSDVAQALGGLAPDKESKRLDSYRSRLHGRPSIQNFVYLDDGLGAIIYLMPLAKNESGPDVFAELQAKLESELGAPDDINQKQGQEWRTYWSNERGEVLLVWNSKKSRSKALKVLFLSVPWRELQKQLGHMP